MKDKPWKYRKVNHARLAVLMGRPIPPNEKISIHHDGIGLCVLVGENLSDLRMFPFEEIFTQEETKK